MVKRVITAIVLLAAAFALIVFKGWVLRGALLVMAGVSMYEMHAAFAKKGMKPARWPAYLFCVLIVLGTAFEEKLAFLQLSPALYALMICVTAGLISVILKGQPDFDGIVATVFPILYPGMFYFCFMRLQNLRGRGIVELALVLTILLPSMNDTFALFVGRAMGKRKLIPGISPNKTVAGAVAGIVASVVFAVAAGLLFPLIDRAVSGAEGAAELFPIWGFALFGLISGFVSQMGDLMASLVKRYCGIKDYGNLFPGHGGMMDRMDAILFNSVLTCLFFLALGF